MPFRIRKRRVRAVPSLDRRTALESRADGARVICVTSGKGGTGKSTLAANLAVHLAGDGSRVTLVDADLGLANAHLLLGVAPGRGLLDLVRTDADVEDVAVATPFGPRLLSGGSGIREIAALGSHQLVRLIRKLERARQQDDWVIIDTGAGIGPGTLMFLWATRDVVLVTNPDLAALTDAYAIVKTLLERAAGHRIGVIVNRARSREQGARAFDKLDRVTRRFVRTGLAHYGTVFESREVGVAGARQRPTVLDDPAGAFTVGIDRIARALRDGAPPALPLPHALREVAPGLVLETRSRRRALEKQAAGRSGNRLREFGK